MSGERMPDRAEADVPAGGQAALGPARGRVSLNVERIGEAVLLAGVTSFFAYMFFESFQWPSEAARVPRIAMGLGVPFLLVRWYRVIRGGEHGGSAQVMDTGFGSSGDAAQDRARFSLIVAFTLLIILGIWLVGVEIAIPLSVLIYLSVFAGVGVVKSAVVSAVLLAIILGLYNEVLNVPWPEPLLSRLFFSDG